MDTCSPTEQHTAARLPAPDVFLQALSREPWQRLLHGTVLNNQSRHPSPLTSVQIILSSIIILSSRAATDETHLANAPALSKDLLRYLHHGFDGGGISLVTVLGDLFFFVFVCTKRGGGGGGHRAETPPLFFFLSTKKVKIKNVFILQVFSYRRLLVVV